MNKNDDREVVINVDHLTKDYGFGRGVFDVSVKVHKGECYGYLGPNGAGKSTTIRHIMGFSSPDKGKTQIFGIDTFGNSEKFLKRVGYLPGEPALPAGLNGNEFIEMMQDLRGERNEERLNYLLDFFSFNPNQDIKEMSLGDKRKLAVVVAFVNDPDVLILDEPTSGLDPLMQEKFISFIIEEKKRGKTILLSSHIFSEVDATCDTISIIKDGVHVSTFNADEFKNGKTQTYVLHFFNEEDLDVYLKEENGYDIVDVDRIDLTVTVEFLRAEPDKFFDSIIDNRIKEFEEKEFSLEEYFMSFYKEERQFGGLSGIVNEGKKEVAVTEVEDKDE